MFEGTYYQFTQRRVLAARALNADLDVDVAVIGGGFAGLNTAMSLQERGVTNVAVLEARDIAFGASGRNGGFVFAGYSLSEAELLSQQGAQAKQMYAHTVAAVNLVRDRIQRNAIDCDLVDEGVIWANWFADPKALSERGNILENHFGVKWDSIAPDRLRQMLGTDRYYGALHETNAMHIHPLNYSHGLAAAIVKNGGQFYENSEARSIQKCADGWVVHTDAGKLRAKHVVMACGGYLSGLDEKIDASILPIATYVMVTEPLGEKLKSCFPGTLAAVYDTRFAFDYYRPLPDSRLLWGGRISVLDRSPSQVQRLLRKDMAKVFPQIADVKVEFAWSGLMGYPRHEMPQLMQLESGLWCAQGFGGHGLAPTAAGGELIAAAIAKGSKEYLQFANYGLVSTFKPLGFVAAQLRYWYLQTKDMLKSRIKF